MRIKIPTLLLGLLAVGFVSQTQAQCTTGQISPNPNPAGNMLSIPAATTTCNGLVPFNNFGEISMGASATLNNDGTLVNRSGGRIVEDKNNGSGASNRVTLNNNLGGIINNELGATVQLHNSNVNNFGVLNNHGFLGGAGMSLRNSGTFNNYGRLIPNVMTNEYGGTWNNSGVYIGDTPDTNNGMINNNPGGSISFYRINNTGTLNNSLGGSFSTNFGSSTNTGILNNSGTWINNSFDGTFINSGQLFISATGVVMGSTSSSGSYSQTAGITKIDGSMTQRAVNINGGVLQGNGSITAPVTVNGGTIAPGNSPGILMINGNYTQSATGTFAAEIGGRIAGVEYDLLKVLGIATLDGALEVTLLDLGDGLFSPHPGDTFDILSAEQIVGSFSDLFFPDLTRGQAEPFMWQIAYLSDAYGTTDVVRLSVVPIPEPEIYAMMIAGLGVLGFVVKRKNRHVATA